MSRQKNITQSEPRNGSSPAEQTAENFVQNGRENDRSRGDMVGNDKLIWELVQKNVEYAGEQFSENLNFNTIVLTNVLYENLYKLIGGKIEEDKFVQWVADELLKLGCVYKGNQELKTESEPQIVVELDQGQYDDLIQKVYQSIELLKANKITIFKLFSDIDNRIREIGSDEDSQIEVSREVLQQRDEKLKGLIDNLNNNRKTIENYLDTHSKVQDEISNAISEAKGGLPSSNEKPTQITEKKGGFGLFNFGGSRSIIDGKGSLLGGRNSHQNGAVGTSKEQSPELFKLKRRIVGIGGNFTQSRKKRDILKRKLLLPFGSSKKNQFSNPFKKPGLIDRMKQKTKDKLVKMRKKISDSSIGKVYRGVKKTAKFIGKTAFAVGKFAVKTAVFAAKTTWSAAKGFYKASKFVGGLIKKGVKKAASAIVSYAEDMKDAIRANDQNALTDLALKPLKAITLFNPAASITKFALKMSWRALKFVGTKIWGIVKKVGLNLVMLFGGMLVIGKKFINKISTWSVRLGKYIADKAYRFMIKPIAGILTAVFGFLMSVIKAPIDFMKWLIPSVLNRIRDCLNSIKQAVKRVLSATISIFKKILFNPMTIALVIGGLFFLLWKFVGGWMTEKMGGLKGGLLSKLKKIGGFILNVVKSVGNVLFTVGKFLFTWIEKITSPDGWLAKAIINGVKFVMMIKHWIVEAMKKSGTSTIDAFCEFLAGDTIGIALRMIGGVVVKIWEWIKHRGLIHTVISMVKAYVGFYTMWAKILINIATAIPRLAWAALPWTKGSVGDCLHELFIEPFTTWWGQVMNIFTGRSEYQEVHVKDNPLESNEEIATNTTISIRNLKKSGMNGNNVSKEMDRLLSVMNGSGSKGVVERLESINHLYQTNSKQVDEYNTFLEHAWELGKGNEEVSKRSLRSMVESVDLSQKLMSAFYYYDPQSGKVMTTRPPKFIEGFLNSIRDMVLDEGMEETEKWKTFIEAFDQLNKERAVIINKQGETITKFTEDMSNLDLKSEGANEKISDMVKSLNNGTMFKNIDVAQSFKQMAKGSAVTENIKSITGSELGTNSLLKIPDAQIPNEQENPITQDQFKVKIPAKNNNEVVPNIVIPPSVNPIPPEPKFEETDSKTMLDKWNEHMKKRLEMRDKGYDSNQLNEMGLKNYTFDEFKKMHEGKQNKKTVLTEKEIKQQEEYKRKKLEGYRLAKNIDAYNHQGKVANASGFDIGGKPSILQIETDGLGQRMYLFSPEWQKVQGASKETDEELLSQIGMMDAKQQEEHKKKVSAAKEAEQRKKDEEERQKRREQEILDYSAKVSGGYIEVKIGEDIGAMRDAYDIHMKKRLEMRDKGYDSNQLNEMGLKNYTFDEFKVYYRKMHGLPEDGIKRIPFEGKKKERDIYKGPRKALSDDELNKYGIELSKDGPVMIPLEQAMKVSSELLSGAKTIYSLRDGLEVMRQGLDSETQKLKNRREEGIPVAAIQMNQSQGNTIVQPIPPSPYQHFENRW